MASRLPCASFPSRRRHRPSVPRSQPSSWRLKLSVGCFGRGSALEPAGEAVDAAALPPVPFSLLPSMMLARLGWPGRLLVVVRADVRAGAGVRTYVLPFLTRSCPLYEPGHPSHPPIPSHRSPTSCRTDPSSRLRHTRVTPQITLPFCSSRHCERGRSQSLSTRNITARLIGCTSVRDWIDWPRVD